MKYIAHIKENGEYEGVEEHLEATAELAQSYAVKEMSAIAHCVGLAHDIGKYSDAFYRRIHDGGARVEHAASGAVELQKLFVDEKTFVDKDALKDKKTLVAMLQYCIVGHHSGLPDGGTPVDNDTDSTLQGRLKRKTEDYSHYRDEIELEAPESDYVVSQLNKYGDADTQSKVEKCELFAFFTRYLFSCLTDADYIATERAVNGEQERSLNGDFNVALERLNEYMSEFVPDTDVKRARAALQSQAQENLNSVQEIGILNMPTGSGKTLCSIKLALEMVTKENATGKNKKKRIIYVIPYTSIIEQTAKELRKIFGDCVEILEHHSNYNFDKEDKDEDSESTNDRLKRTCENWDAKIIVTTSVQFFESLYHYRGSRLRKLHNLADSVMVFDEIHLIPINCIQPCLRGIGYITKHLNSTALFLSATMPDYTPLFKLYCPQNAVASLITDKSDFDAFGNCEYESLDEIELDTLLMKIAECKNSLTVVNSRRAAQEIYTKLNGKKFHLSTYMCPVHRSAVIDEIRRLLSNDEEISVVSTSLIEAGVDLDFSMVFRELAGLDNILQAGGRCNREGKREGSKVHIYTIRDNQNKNLDERANITRSILKEYRSITSPECIEDYYSRLFGANKDSIESNMIMQKQKKPSPKSIPFRTYAESFEYINDSSIGIVVNYNEESSGLLKKLKNGDLSVRRSLQPYTVSVNYYVFRNLLELGAVKDYNGIFVLEAGHYYNQEMGLYLDTDGSQIT